MVLQVASEYFKNIHSSVVIFIFLLLCYLFKHVQTKDKEASQELKFSKVFLDASHLET